MKLFSTTFSLLFPSSTSCTNENNMSKDVKPDCDTTKVSYVNTFQGIRLRNCADRVCNVPANSNLGFGFGETCSGIMTFFNIHVPFGDELVKILKHELQPGIPLVFNESSNCEILKIEACLKRGKPGQ